MKLPSPLQLREGISRRHHLAILSAHVLLLAICLGAGAFAVHQMAADERASWKILTACICMAWPTVSVMWETFVLADELWVQWPNYAAGKRSGGR
jgi:hypothetical protein